MDRALLAHYLAHLAQVLRREEHALGPVLERARRGLPPTAEDVLLVAEAARASLLYGAHLALMLATYLSEEAGEVEEQ